MQTEPSRSDPAAPHKPFLTYQRAKMAIWIVAVVAGGIVIWQNWVTIDTPILFMTVRMPRAMFVLVTLLVGFVIGLVTPGLLRRRKNKT